MRYHNWCPEDGHSANGSDGKYKIVKDAKHSHDVRVSLLYNAPAQPRRNSVDGCSRLVRRRCPSAFGSNASSGRRATRPSVDYRKLTPLLAFLQVSINRIQVEPEPGRILFTNPAHFVNNRVFGHLLSPPSIPQACKAPAVRSSRYDRPLRSCFASVHLQYEHSSTLRGTRFHSLRQSQCGVRRPQLSSESHHDRSGYARDRSHPLLVQAPVAPPATTGDAERERDHQPPLPARRAVKHIARIQTGESATTSGSAVGAHVEPDPCSAWQSDS